MQRKMAAFKCQCIDICKWDISTLVRDSGGVHGDDSVASTHRLLPAEMVQARLVPGVLLLLQRPGLLWGSCVPFLCSWCGLGMSKMSLPAQPREPNPLSIVIQLWRLQPVRCQSICEQSHALVSMVSRWSPAHIDKDIFMCLSLDMNLRSKTFLRCPHTCTSCPLRHLRELWAPMWCSLWETSDYLVQQSPFKQETTGMWSMTWTSTVFRLRKVLKKFCAALNLWQLML